MIKVNSQFYFITRNYISSVCFHIHYYPFVNGNVGTVYYSCWVIGSKPVVVCNYNTLGIGTAITGSCTGFKYMLICE